MPDSSHEAGRPTLTSLRRSGGDLATQTSWYKGNLHMHSLWSDGSDCPEFIAARYREAGYHFIAFTEHDRFQEGEHPLRQEDPGASAGDRGTVAVAGIALKSLSEYRDTLEEPERFLILNGEEVTVNCRGRCHWINVINAPQPIGPSDCDGDTPEAIQSVLSQVARFDRPCLVSFNHPNYLWNATAEDLARADALRFFEMHTALNSACCYGDAARAGAERIWDVALGLRLARGCDHPLFGIATDDSHRYASTDEGVCRAWIMVRAPELTANALIRALHHGDFYASTGITLAGLETNASGISLTIEPAAGVNYTTRFIGTRRGADMSGTPVLGENGVPLHTTKRYAKDVGEVLKTVDGPEATFAFGGGEAYVRALITSDCAHPCPAKPGDVMKAWVQPVFPEACCWDRRAR